MPIRCYIHISSSYVNSIATVHLGCHCLALFWGLCCPNCGGLRFTSYFILLNLPVACAWPSFLSQWFCCLLVTPTHASLRPFDLALVMGYPTYMYICTPSKDTYILTLYTERSTCIVVVSKPCPFLWEKLGQVTWHCHGNLESAALPELNSWFFFISLYSF